MFPFQKMSQQNNHSTFDLAPVPLSRVRKELRKVDQVKVFRVAVAGEFGHGFEPGSLVLLVKGRQIIDGPHGHIQISFLREIGRRCRIVSRTISTRFVHYLPSINPFIARGKTSQVVW